MASESAGRALFQAIANFAQLRREAKSGKRSLSDLKDEAHDASSELDKTAKASDRASEKIGKLDKSTRSAGSSAKSLRQTKLEGFFRGVEKAGANLGSTLKNIRKGVVGLSAISVAATASIGPVLGLVGAVVQLSGAAGVLPGVWAAVGAASAVLKVAMLGMDDVMKKLGGSYADFQASIKDLPPEMQRVAKTMRDLLPAVKSIKDAIQSRFFDGLEVPMRRLAATYIPMLRQQGGLLAETLNTMAKEAAGFFEQRSTATDMHDGLVNINSAWTNMIGVVRPLLQVVTDVFAVSTSFLPQLTKGAGGAAKQFAAFVHNARETGKLKAWIQTGIDAVKQLGHVLWNVGRIFGAVFKAGKDSGHGFLQTLAEITDKFADFLNSAKGQKALKTLFTEIAKAVDVMKPVVAALGNAFIKILPIFVEVGKHLAPGVVDLINGLSKAIQHAKPFLISMADGLSDLMSAIGNAGPLLDAIVQGLVWAASPLGVLADVIRLITHLFSLLPKPLQDAAGLIIGIGIAAVGAGSLLGKLSTAVFGLGKNLGRVLKLAGKLPGLGALGKFGEKISGGGKATTAASGAETGAAQGAAESVFSGGGKAADKAGQSTARRFASALGRGLKGAGKFVFSGLKFMFSGLGGLAASAGEGIMAAFKWATPAFAAVLRGIGSAFTLLGVGLRALGAAMLANPIIAIATAIALIAILIITHWDQVKQWIAAFWAWLQPIFQAIGAFFVMIWTAIRDFFVMIWQSIVTALQAALTFIQTLWTTVWTAVKNFFVAIWNGIRNAGIAVWNALKAALTAVLNAIRAVWTAVWGAVKAVGLAIWNGIRNAASAVFNGIKNVITSVLGVIRSVWTSVWGAIKNVVSGIWNGITSIITGAIGVIKSVVGGFVDFFQGVWNTIKRIFNAIGDAISWVGDRISDVGHALNPANWFAEGGLVPGSGRKHYPVMVQPGEYIMPVKETQENLPLLRSMNPHDSGGTLDPNEMAAAAAGNPIPSMRVGAFSSPRGGDGAAAPGGDVYVTLQVSNPLPEKASETAVKRVGQAARIGVSAAIGGVA
jgi:phage-related protein